MGNYKGVFREFVTKIGNDPIAGHLWIDDQLVPTSTLRLLAPKDSEDGYLGTVSIIDDRETVIFNADVRDLARYVEGTVTSFDSVDMLVDYIHDIMSIPIITQQVGI